MNNMSNKQEKRQVLTPEELNKIRLERDMKSVMDTEEGRRVMWHLISICGVYQDNFHGNSKDFRALGRRSIGLELLSMLMDSNSKLFLQMQQEHLKNNT